jgi:hypothetical protein
MIGTEIVRSTCLTERTLFGVALIVGLGRAWAGRHLMNPDGVSYLDLGDAYLQGDWQAAVNALWSPLYSWILGLGLKVLQPSMEWEFPAVRFINFLIYLAALGCFRYFWAGSIRFQQSRDEVFRQQGLLIIPKSVWIALGYTIFIVSAAETITLEVVGADMCAAAFVFLASGVMVRARMAPGSLNRYFLLGIALGFGYLAKAVLLPLSLSFVIAGVVRQARLGSLLLRGAVVTAGIALVATPYIIALSKKQGTLTYSEAGKLNYAWAVNGFPLWWVGDPPGSGTPVHPRRKIFDHPAAYEFEGTPPGTYPGWYDPAYWVAGIKPRFNLRQQLAAIKNDVLILFNLFSNRFHIALLVCFATSYLLCDGWRNALTGFRDNWFWFVPPLMAAMVYAPLWIEPRYIGPFVPLFCAGLLSGLRISDTPSNRVALTRVTAGTVVVTLLAVSGSTVVAVNETGVGPRVSFEVARLLREMGVRPGDRVGSIGRVLECGWARLARVKIATEINLGSAADFRVASDRVRTEALSALFRTGVTAIVSDYREETGCETGWRRAGRTNFSICMAAGAPR